MSDQSGDNQLVLLCLAVFGGTLGINLVLGGIGFLDWLWMAALITLLGFMLWMLHQLLVKVMHAGRSGPIPWYASPLLWLGVPMLLVMVISLWSPEVAGLTIDRAALEVP